MSNNEQFIILAVWSSGRRWKTVGHHYYPLLTVRPLLHDHNVA